MADKTYWRERQSYVRFIGFQFPCGSYVARAAKLESHTQELDFIEVASRHRQHQCGR